LQCSYERPLLCICDDLGCADECSTGETGCIDTDTIYTCGEANDGDDCLDKIADTCPTAGTCNGGICQVTSSCIDNDDDGYGNPASSDCTYPSQDCDDGDNEISPGKNEICGNSVDENCDGEAQECSSLLINIVEPRNETYSENDFLSFRATAMNGSPTYLYIWTSSIDGELYRGDQSSFYPGEGDSLAPEGETLTVGNHIITLTVTDNEGATNSVSKNVEIISSSDLYASFILESDIFPANTDIYLSTWVGGGSEPYTYQWSSNIDGIFSTNNRPIFNSSSEGQHIIELLVTDSTGATYVSTKTIEIRSGPVIGYVGPNNQTFEDGQNIFFYAGIQGGVDPVSASWTSDISGFLSNELQFSLSRLDIGIHRITLEIEDAEGKTDSQIIMIEVITPVCIDSDGDGYGRNKSLACVDTRLDCNDENEFINPGADEICGNEIDENCNWNLTDCVLDFSILEPATDGQTFNWGENKHFRVEQNDTYIDLLYIHLYIYNNENNYVKNVFLRDDGSSGDTVAGDYIFEGDSLWFLDPGEYSIKIRYGMNYSSILRTLNTTDTRPNCEVVVNNGDSEDKLDIVFVAEGYNSDEFDLFETKVAEGYNRLFATEPYSSSSSLVNISIVESTIDLGCGYSDSNGPDCTQTNAKQIASVCSTDRVIILSNHTFRSHAYYGGVAFVSAPGYHWPGVVVHEFGHSFSRLADEYVSGDGDRGEYAVISSYNCDVDSACSKWSDFPEAGCFDGCMYMNGYYRSVSNGIMRTSTGWDYGAWNIERIKDYLSNYK